MFESLRKTRVWLKRLHYNKEPVSCRLPDQFTPTEYYFLLAAEQKVDVKATRGVSQKPLVRDPFKSTIQTHRPKTELTSHFIRKIILLSR